MGNSRQFRAGRQAARENLKQRNARLIREAGYYRGLAMAAAAELEATKMERPPDLDEWVESILPDMDDDERATWDAMSDTERENFKKHLGVKINATKIAAES